MILLLILILVMEIDEIMSKITITGMTLAMG